MGWCFCFVLKISSVPSCLKNIWRCRTFLEFVIEDLVVSSWTGKTGYSRLLSAQLYHDHAYLFSNTSLIEIGHLCIFINILFCTSISQQRCSSFCKAFRCMFKIKRHLKTLFSKSVKSSVLLVKKKKTRLSPSQCEVIQLEEYLALFKVDSDRSYTVSVVPLAVFLL